MLEFGIASLTDKISVVISYIGSILTPIQIFIIPTVM